MFVLAKKNIPNLFVMHNFMHAIMLQIIFYATIVSYLSCDKMRLLLPINHFFLLSCIAYVSCIATSIVHKYFSSTIIRD